MQEMFLFHTDAVELTDALPADVLFLLNTVSDLSGVIVNSLCVAGGDADATYVSDNITSYVMSTTSVKNSSSNQLVYTAKQLFNICAGVDLFTNEAAFMQDLNVASQTSLNAELGVINAASWVQADASYNTFAHPSYVILQNILSASVARVADLAAYAHADVASQTAYKLPILAGDSIQFIMTVNTAQTKIDASAISARTYRFKLNVIA
jgi:hypothetical protein